MSDAARTSLDQLATFLRDRPEIRIVLEGHAAESGPPGDRVEIAARRAQVVADYLVSMGIAGERLELISWGSSQPTGGGSDVEALSRRVDIRPAG